MQDQDYQVGSFGNLPIYALNIAMNNKGEEWFAVKGKDIKSLITREHINEVKS
jgi:hypothetical protein